MFCPECGFNAENSKFCLSCGNNLQQTSQQTAPTPSQIDKPRPTVDHSTEEVVIWSGRPDGLIDKALSMGNINKIEYKLTNQRIVATYGLIGTKETEIELRRVKDIKVKQNLTEKVLNVGDITMYSTDITEGVFILKNVSGPFQVKEMIRKAVSDLRSSLNINYHEHSSF